MTIYFGRIRMYKQKKQWIRQDKYFGQMVSCTKKGNKKKKKKKKDKKEGHIFGSNRRLQSKEMNNEDLMFISNAQTKEKINNRGS